MQTAPLGTARSPAEHQGKVEEWTWSSRGLSERISGVHGLGEDGAVEEVIHRAVWKLGCGESGLPGQVI